MNAVTIEDKNILAKEIRGITGSILIYLTMSWFTLMGAGFGAFYSIKQDLSDKDNALQKEHIEREDGDKAIDIKMSAMEEEITTIKQNAQLNAIQIHEILTKLLGK